jgi:aminoglycoside phosphotransferase (APT) family kinase protein
MLKSSGHYPSPAALRWVADALGSGATVQAISPLAGATSSVLHSIEVNYQGHIVKTVLRQFVDAEWLKAEPDLALHEAASLNKAINIGVATPELIAYDEKGDECGVPATLMTQLPGTVLLKPTNFDVWLHQLAEALLHVHAIEAGDFPWSYYPYNDISRLEPPRWSSFPKAWEKAIEVVAGKRPATRERFIHRDYHPNNVLWQDGRISGVVDWVNACRGAHGLDVAWCRMNLAQLYGVEAADRYLDAYEALAGQGFEYHPFWDLIAAIELLPGPPGVYPGWTAFGMMHLDEELMRARADDYLSSLIARV